jgi:hypothetical protein
MKRLVLLSLAALMLVATVFAPVAMAQEQPGEVHIQSVTLGTAGTVDVTATIECTPGLQYSAFVEVRQTTGNHPFNQGSNGYPQTGNAATCQSTEPETFAVTVIGQKPFKKGTALVSGGSLVCEPGAFCTQTRTPYEEFRLR